MINVQLTYEKKRQFYGKLADSYTAKNNRVQKW